MDKRLKTLQSIFSLPRELLEYVAWCVGTDRVALACTCVAMARIVRCSYRAMVYRRPPEEWEIRMPVFPRVRRVRILMRHIQYDPWRAKPPGWTTVEYIKSRFPAIETVDADFEKDLESWNSMECVCSGSYRDTTGSIPLRGIMCSDVALSKLLSEEAVQRNATPNFAALDYVECFTHVRGELCAPTTELASWLFAPRTIRVEVRPPRISARYPLPRGLVESGDVTVLVCAMLRSTEAVLGTKADLHLAVFESVFLGRSRRLLRGLHYPAVGRLTVRADSLRDDNSDSSSEAICTPFIRKCDLGGSSLLYRESMQDLPALPLDLDDVRTLQYYTLFEFKGPPDGVPNGRFCAKAREVFILYLSTVSPATLARMTHTQSTTGTTLAWFLRQFLLSCTLPEADRLFPALMRFATAQLARLPMHYTTFRGDIPPNEEMRFFMELAEDGTQSERDCAYKIAFHVAQTLPEKTRRALLADTRRKSMLGRDDLWFIYGYNRDARADHIHKLMQTVSISVTTGSRCIDSF